VVLKGRGAEVPLVYLLVLILQEKVAPAQPASFQQAPAAGGSGGEPPEARIAALPGAAAVPALLLTHCQRWGRNHCPAGLPLAATLASPQAPSPEPGLQPTRSCLGSGRVCQPQQQHRDSAAAAAPPRLGTLHPAHCRAAAPASSRGMAPARSRSTGQLQGSGLSPLALPRAAPGRTLRHPCSPLPSELAEFRSPRSLQPRVASEGRLLPSPRHCGGGPPSPCCQPRLPQHHSP